LPSLDGAPESPRESRVWERQTSFYQRFSSANSRICSRVSRNCWFANQFLIIRYYLEIAGLPQWFGKRSPKGNGSPFLRVGPISALRRQRGTPMARCRWMMLVRRLNRAIDTWAWVAGGHEVGN
jgi:hypothetical protein